MKILVADDSPSFRAALTRMLVEAGYEVVRARDGVEALSVFYVEQPDVVVEAIDRFLPRVEAARSALCFKPSTKKETT